MSCRNASLIEYSPILTRLTNCNSAPLMLGAGQSAKGAGLYMCKYMVKEAYALAASLSVLLDARQNIAAYPTQASDSGADRTAKHFLQRVLNSTTAELAPTQAAAIVLGMPSSGHSHSFVYCYIWDAIRLTGILARGAHLFSDGSTTDAAAGAPSGDALGLDDNGDPISEPSGASAHPDKDDHAQDGEPLADLESDGELEPSAAGSGGRVGAAGVYTIADGVKVAVAQAEHFAFRDPALHALNYDEFVMSCRVEKVKPEEIERCNAPHPAAGRPRKRAYRFLEPHPLRECYVLREKAKFDVPVLVGDPPPRLPTRMKNGARSPVKELDHAQYYGTMFIPWSAGGEINMTPAVWQAHVASLEATASQVTCDPQQLALRDVARGRLWRIKQVAGALVTDARKAQLMSKWRSRSRTLWSASGPAEKLDRARGAGAADALDGDLRREIDEIQSAAPRPKDASSIQRAAAAERWVDEVTNKLTAAQGNAPQRGGRPPWDSRAPSPRGPLAHSLPGGASDIRAMIQSLQQPRVQEAPPGDYDSGAVVASGDAGEGLDDADPAEFIEISEADFARSQVEYAKLRKDTPQVQALPPRPLNLEQRQFGRDQFKAQRILATGRAAGEDRGETLQKLVRDGLRQVSLLHGPGGAGKTVLLQAQERVLSRYKFGKMATTAWTGVAAAPFRAPTLCSLLGIEFAKLHQEPQKTEKQMGAIRTAYALYYGEPTELLVFVVDEVSFLDPAALHWLDMILRWLVNQPSVPFGGVLVQLAGDFWQKPPPAGTSLAELLVAADAPMRKSKVFPPTSPMAKGLDIFRHARRTLLTRQMRAAEDAEFQEVLTQVRSTDTEPPIPRAFVRDLKELSAADVSAEPARAFAPIVVLGNQERHRLNHHQVYAFARTYNLPLVRWRLPLASKDADSLASETLSALLDNEPGLWQYFVRGAPCMLLQNVQPTKSMANGSTGFMHSLSFEDVAPPELAAAEASMQHCVVELPQPPLTINVQLLLASDDAGAGIESLTPGATVMPVLASTAMLE